CLSPPPVRACLPWTAAAKNKNGADQMICAVSLSSVQDQLIPTAFLLRSRGSADPHRFLA
ncbi:hypothetical protein, partial [Brevundimonas sp.]|uniref:hypothetical protein n=1 Tax=Brevundimonas sp. TaxID=1871086 RepID=UPI002FCADDA7